MILVFYFGPNLFPPSLSFGLGPSRTISFEERQNYLETIIPGNPVDWWDLISKLSHGH